MTIPFLYPPVNFPSPRDADANGIVAYGGDLLPDTLLQAYNKGIFPWFGEDDPFPIWWSPPERMVMLPGKHKVSRSMRPYLNSNKYRFTLDTCFERVIRSCRTAIRNDQPGTWITESMVDAYCALHQSGYAHSAEIWENDELIGGLYGVSLGAVFCGESMFSYSANASKIAFIRLSEFLSRHRFILLDCQNYTPHLEKLGAVLITRENYLEILEKALEYNTLKGNWGKLNR